MSADDRMALAHVWALERRRDWEQARGHMMPGEWLPGEWHPRPPKTERERPMPLMLNQPFVLTIIAGPAGETGRVKVEADLASAADLEKLISALTLLRPVVGPAPGPSREPYPIGEVLREQARRMGVPPAVVTPASNLHSLTFRSDLEGVSLVVNELVRTPERATELANELYARKWMLDPTSGFTPPTVATEHDNDE